MALSLRLRDIGIFELIDVSRKGSQKDDCDLFISNPDCMDEGSLTTGGTKEELNSH